MKANNLFQISVMTAITETQKALNQRYAVTGETFDPFQSDAQDFTLRHQKKAVKEPHQSHHTPQAAAPRQKTEPFSGEGPAPSEERMRPAPAIEENTPDTVHRSSGKHAAPVGRLNAADLRRAVILSEIIGPPVSRRGR